MGWRVQGVGGGAISALCTFAGFPSGNLRRQRGVRRLRTAPEPPMRMTIPPLGASGRSATSVAAAIVDYLEGARRAPGPAMFHAAGSGAAVAYYADSPEG